MAYLFKDSIKERIEESTIYVSDRVFDELDEVYRKAKVFDEIINELKYQLENLEKYDTLDYKDCQTLLQILNDMGDE